MQNTVGVGSKGQSRCEDWASMEWKTNIFLHFSFFRVSSLLIAPTLFNISLLINGLSALVGGGEAEIAIVTDRHHYSLLQPHLTYCQYC